MAKEEMFNKNIKLAYKVANKYKINNLQEFEDIKQVALMGLWKAVLNYNGEHALSTFAYVVIQNEINFYLRKTKKNENEISIKTEIHENLTLEDTLQAEDNIEQLLENIEMIEVRQMLDNVLKNEKEKNKKIYELQERGYKQREIGEVVNLSQVQVSRIIKKINKKVSDKVVNS